MIRLIQFQIKKRLWISKYICNKLTLNQQFLDNERYECEPGNCAKDISLIGKGVISMLERYLNVCYHIQWRLSRMLGKESKRDPYHWYKPYLYASHKSEMYFTIYTEN